MITLILGGMKSGKSDHALDLFQKAPGPGLFIPTGKAIDLAFREQILAHRRERSPDIRVREIGTDLPEALEEAKKDFASILVDSLDFWLFARMGQGGWDLASDALEATLQGWRGPQLFIVSSETGLGPMPGSSEAIAFARNLGRLNRMVATCAGTVHLVAAGIPLTLKSAGKQSGKAEG